METYDGSAVSTSDESVPSSSAKERLSYLHELQVKINSVTELYENKYKFKIFILILQIKSLIAGMREKLFSDSHHSGKELAHN